jgi:hypothetical protein
MTMVLGQLFNRGSTETAAALKNTIKDKAQAVKRGLTETKGQRDEIEVLVKRLEKKNPTKR